MTFGSVVLLLILIIVYFVPTRVANNRRHKNRTAITVLNVFAGWTVVGWVIALVWACTDNVEAIQRP